MKKQLKKQQEEAEKEEKEQRRREKEEAEQKKQLALQKQASVLERFLKKSKSRSPTQVNQPIVKTCVTDILPKQAVQVPESVTQSMDHALSQKDEFDVTDLRKVHLDSWHRLGHCSQKLRRRKQLIQFDKSHKPAFYGYWHRKSELVRGCCPLVKDPDLDYEIDSDEEWEEDNTLHSWILDGNSILEVRLPPNILGTKISSDVRSFDVNLLNPMYQARSLKAAVEFFWIGGQKLQKDQESDDENFPGSPNMDLVNWGHNILWYLKQYEHLKKPLVVWDITSALSDFKKSEPNYVEQMLVKWLILNLGFEWGPSLDIVLQQVYGCLSNLTSRQLHLINLISRHVVLNEAKLTNTNGESDKEEPKLWVKLLEMSEKELRERLIGCSFLATINGCNGNWQAVGLAQMRQWVANNDCKDYFKLLASEVQKIEKRCVAEEECSYCSAPVVFQDTKVAYCRADKCSKQGATQKHKLERCAVSMTVCPLTPSWFCCG